jgi:F-type H+-transporting ATPase subunit delta
MGSATREALAASRAELTSMGSADLATADELFSAGRIIGSSAQLEAMLSDTTTGLDEKRAILAAVFGAGLSQSTLTLLVTVVTQRWSSTESRNSACGPQPLRLRRT